MTTSKWIATAIVVAILLVILWELIQRRKRWTNRLLNANIKDVEGIRKMLKDSKHPVKGVVAKTFKNVGGVGPFPDAVEVLETMLLDALLEMFNYAQKGDVKQFEKARVEALSCQSGLLRLKIAIIGLQKREIDIKREALKNRRK